MSDASEPLHESLRELVNAEKTRPDPSSEVQERTFDRLSTTLGLGAGLGEAAGHTLSRMLTRGSSRAWATFLVGAAVGATVYGTAAHLRQEPKSPPPPSIPAVSPRPPEAAPFPIEQPPVLEAPSVDQATPRAPAAPPSTTGRGLGESAGAGSRDGRLSAERNLIEIARTALARGRVDGALAILRRHLRLYPKGQFAEERDSLLIQSLVAKGDYSQARESASRFRRQHPNSLFSPAIEQALQSIP